MTDVLELDRRFDGQTAESASAANASNAGAAHGHRPRDSDPANVHGQRTSDRSRRPHPSCCYLLGEHTPALVNRVLKVDIGHFMTVAEGDAF